MSGHWCYLCKLCRSLFADAGHKAGEMWTMAELLRVAQEVDGGTPKHGVKSKPWWPFIPLENYVIPLLHLLIGIGNDLLQSFRDWVNEEIECLDHQEVLTRRAVRDTKHKIVDTIADRDEWDAAPRGKNLASVKRKIAARMTKLKKLGAIITVVSKDTTKDSSPVDVAELLKEVQEFVAADNDVEEEEGPDFFADENEEAARDGEDEEEVDPNGEDDDFRIAIPASAPENV